MLSASDFGVGGADLWGEIFGDIVYTPNMGL